MIRSIIIFIVVALSKSFSLYSRFEVKKSPPLQAFFEGLKGWVKRKGSIPGTRFANAGLFMRTSLAGFIKEYPI